MNSASVGVSRAFVGKAIAARPARVLAVLDLPDTSNSQRNEPIVEQAALLAQRTGAELHVASAYSTYPADAHTVRVERYLPALRVKARDRRRSAIRQLLRRMKITHAFVHVVEGESPQAIDALASSLNAVVVGGAAARTDDSRVTVDDTRPPQHFAA